ncbi:MAG: hypothetical protein R3F34_07060 [Planctomycetota bacterium]
MPQFVTAIRILPAALALAAGPAAAQDIELFPHDTRWRLTLQHLDPPSGSTTGLVGIHYDLLHPFRSYPNLYVGAATYAGVVGDRGGFLATGFEGGLRRSIGDGWWLEGGLFAGGGGSGIGDDGTGLVLRPHVALEAPLSESWNWRLELAYWSTPGGDSDGVQLALGVSGARNLLTGDWSFGELDELNPNELMEVPTRVEPIVVLVDPSSGTRRSGSSEPDRRFGLVGVRMHHSLGRNLYVPVEYAAAAAGDSGGFRQIMFGLGEWGPRFTPWVWGVKEVLIGAAGGGGYDTGGGLAGRVNVGLEFPFDEGWSASVTGGYEWAFGGHFDAWTMQASVSWTPQHYALPKGFDRTRLTDEALAESDVELEDWIVSVSHKSLKLRSDAVRRDGGPIDGTVSMAGIGLEREIAPNLDLLVDTYSAWNGDVGGQQEILTGLRYRLDALRPWDVHGQFYVKFELGAGSGPADTGSGLLQEFGAGWRFSPSDGLWAAVEALHVSSTSGSFEGDGLGLHLGWAFSRPVAR